MKGECNSQPTKVVLAWKYQQIYEGKFTTAVVTDIPYTSGIINIVQTYGRQVVWPTAGGLKTLNSWELLPIALGFELSLNYWLFETDSCDISDCGWLCSGNMQPSVQNPYILHMFLYFLVIKIKRFFSGSTLESVPDSPLTFVAT